MAWSLPRGEVLQSISSRQAGWTRPNGAVDVAVRFDRVRACVAGTVRTRGPASGRCFSHAGALQGASGRALRKFKVQALEISDSAALPDLRRHRWTGVRRQAGSRISTRPATWPGPKRAGVAFATFEDRVAAPEQAHDFEGPWSFFRMVDTTIASQPEVDLKSLSVLTLLYTNYHHQGAAWALIDRVGDRPLAIRFRRAVGGNSAAEADA